MKMKPTIKKRWVAALRSGKYKRGKNRLRDASDNSFCCLGVLTDLYVKQKKQKWTRKKTIDSLPSISMGIKDGGEHEYIETALLPSVVQKWAGLENASPQVNFKRQVAGGKIEGAYGHRGGSKIDLSALNDDTDASFEQIAELIETRL